MERKTQQILTAAAVLISATVLSFGVRHVRVMVHRARIDGQPVSGDTGSKEYSGAEPVAFAQTTHPRERVGLPIDEDRQFTDKYADEPVADSEQVFPEENEKYDRDQEKDRYAAGKKWDKSAVFADKIYSKRNGDYKKGVEYVPTKLSETETLYAGKPGEYWLVQKLPDGGVAKMQMQEIDGELQPVSEAETYAPKGGEGKSGGGNGK